jgi:glutamine synthetase adenylyltransferase
MKINDLLKDSAAATPDPERAFTNLKRLLQKSPKMIEGHAQWLGDIARLFSYSQFLADYCIKKPDNLFSALKDLSAPLNRQEIVSQSRSEVKAFSREPAACFRKEVMKFLREKRSYLLYITLRILWILRAWRTAWRN